MRRPAVLATTIVLSSILWFHFAAEAEAQGTPQQVLAPGIVWNRDPDMGGGSFSTGYLTDQCYTGIPWGGNSWGLEASSWVNDPTYAIDWAYFSSSGDDNYVWARDASGDWSFARYIQGDVWGGSNCGAIPWYLPAPLPTYGNDLTLKIDIKRASHSLEPTGSGWYMLALNAWFSSPELPAGDDKNGRKPLVMDLVFFLDCNWSGCGLNSFEDAYGYHYQAFISETPEGNWRTWTVDLDTHIQQALAHTWGTTGSIADVEDSLHLYQLEFVVEVWNAQGGAYIDDYSLEFKHPEAISLEELAWPGSDYRWLDVANQAYSTSYATTYTYDDATVSVTYEPVGSTLAGTLTATGLKPNFAYQLKLSGTPGTPANERIGLAGRWWEEEWTGSAWTGGHNLNNKGTTGSSPNPNDDVYFDRYDEEDPLGTSPTGLRYRYTGYYVFDYFITDENGDATVAFETDSSYHVLWATNDSDGNDGTGHADRTDSDGPLVTVTFDGDDSTAYPDTGGDDYDPKTVSVFGEWERKPVGSVFLNRGVYSAQMILTEESFHGSGGAAGSPAAEPPGAEPMDTAQTGTWAAAMGAPIAFSIDAPTAVDLVSFTTAPQRDSVLVRWAAASEVDVVGFNLYRATGPAGELTQLNTHLIPVAAPGSPLGARYEFVDEAIEPGTTYTYWLEDVDTQGVKTRHGPVSATALAEVPRRVFLPLMRCGAR